MSPTCEISPILLTLLKFAPARPAPVDPVASARAAYALAALSDESIPHAQRAKEYCDRATGKSPLPAAAAA